MRKLTLSTVCMIAALSTAPAFAGPNGKPGTPAPAGDMECTQTPPAHAPGKNAPRGEEMDCMVVMGYPSQDGRATLRHSLEKAAKENLAKVIRKSRKNLESRKPTS